MAVKADSALQQSRYLPVFQLSFLYPRYWLTWTGLALFFVLSLMPVRCIDTVAVVLGNLAYRKNHKRAHIARRNLQLCFNQLDTAAIERLVQQHFRAQLRSVLHYGLIWWAPAWRLRAMFEMQGDEQIEHYRAQGRNVIALTCHSVGLEFAVVAFSMRGPGGGPFKPMGHPVIDWLVAKGRRRFGARIFARNEGLRAIIKNTRLGCTLVYLGDEDLGADAGVFVPFFGVQKATVAVLGRLAKSCDAVVLPTVCCYDEASRKYIVRLLPALQNFPEGDDAADAHAMNAAIEQAVMQCVPQYFWTLKWFRTTPPGEHDRYQ